MKANWLDQNADESHHIGKGAIVIQGEMRYGSRETNYLLDTEMTFIFCSLTTLSLSPKRGYTFECDL